MNVIKKAATEAVISRSRSVSEVRGYIRGLRQPSFIFRLKAGTEPSARVLSVVDTFVRQRYSGSIQNPSPYSGVPVAIEHVLMWAQIILKKNDHAILEDAKLWQALDHAPREWSIAQPCGSVQAGIAAIDLAVSLLNMAGARSEIDGIGELGAKLNRISEHFAAPLKHGGLIGFNKIHFLNAANEIGVPWSNLGGNIFQFGHGASARLLSSSFTDRTPQISTAIARSKQLAAKIMWDAGLPIQPHKIATSREQAVQIAEQLGYPAVVKPADLDGGIGVTALLYGAEAVGQAFDRARAHSANILVEKHFFGVDYRIQVVDGQVQGVLEREPAGVTGDGVRSISQLVADQNSERATATDERRYLHAIKPDDEAASLLKAARLTWDSVPAVGQVIRLRGAANVASGGIPRAISIEKIHPDNLELALRAARILRLDVAGVDLLIPNIGESWLKTGAAICEVNAQPQMFSTMHRPMMESLLGGGNGRIPIVLVLSDTPQHSVCVGVHQKMRAFWPNTARLDEAGAIIAEQQVAPKGGAFFQGCRSLLHDPKTQALVLSCSSIADISQGWPIDRIDILVLAGGSSKEGNTANDLTALTLSAAWLNPACVIVDGTSQACVAARQALPEPVPTIIAEGSGDTLVNQIATSCIGHLLLSFGKTSE